MTAARKRKPRCKAMASPKGIAHILGKRQCEREAKRDGYCTQHHPDTIKAREDKREALWRSRESAYVCKPAIPPTLARVVDAAMNRYRKLKRVDKGMNTLKSVNAWLKADEDEIAACAAHAAWKAKQRRGKP